MREKLIALSLLKKGNWEEMAEFIKKDPELNRLDYETSLALTNQLECLVLTLFDDDYPNVWRDMPQPPFVVYLIGDISLLNDDFIAVIGGKSVPPFAKSVINKLIYDKTEDLKIATGSEMGIEEYVIATERFDIQFIGRGFDKTDVGDKLLISEIPPEDVFDLSAFYRSYKLMCELSTAIIIISLSAYDRRSHYLNYLADIGKEIYVVPEIKSRMSKGGLELINKGAKIFFGIDEVGN